MVNKGIRILIVLSILIFLIGCTPATNKGVGFVNSGDFKQSLLDADGAGSYIGFYTLMDASKDIPEIVAVAYENPLKLNSEPIVNVNFFEVRTGTAVANYAGGNFKQQILNIASKYKPKYIGVGNEVNLYGNIDEFALVYNDIYDAVKEASPNTKIFTVFQYDKLNDISIINKFKLDAVGVTTYPEIVGQKTDSIPADYYSTLKNIKKPIIFTEMGVSSNQISFMDRMEKEFPNSILIWGLLYDVPSYGFPWDSMGLIKTDGARKDAYIRWTK